MSNDMLPDENGSDLTVSDVVGDVLLGASVPAPLRKGFFKAFHRLCSAAIDIPVAYLEGKADELRAETKARTKLVETTADQIAAQMRTDPEYARRAVHQFGRKILREQANLDSITLKSAELIASGDLTGSSPNDNGPINDDWLNSFDTEARTKSTEEMQAYFSRILAGEIERPNSYSIKSLRILGSLNSDTARLFEKLCSMCVTTDNPFISTPDARVISMGGNASNNALAEFGLSFSHLNILNEHGLIISDYNSWRDYQVSISVSTEDRANLSFRLPFSFQKKYWVLMPKSSFDRNAGLRLHGVALTESGRELMRIVDVISAETYTQKLIQYFHDQQLTMVESSDDGLHTIRFNVEK